MKYTLILFSFIYLTILSEAKAQIASNWQVATWSQFKTAAVSYTFDDNCSNQIPLALPLFDQYNYKVTFFAVTNWGPNWSALLTASANGHEVGSHTITHPASLANLSITNQDNELKQSQSTINSNITNANCVTLAYPNCVRSDLGTTQKYYIAARGCQGSIEQSTPGDFYNISSIITGNTGAIQKAADFNNKVAAAKASKGWCVFLTHGIDNDGGYSPTQSAEIKSHLSYMNTHKADFWVATFGNVVKYIKERNAVSLAETVITSDSLQLTVTDNLENTLYNVPISVRRVLPNGWENPKVYMNGTLATSTLSTINGTTYIVFDVTPDQGKVYLANTNTNTPVNPSPIVSITSPANNASFVAPASIAINASATDADGSVASVKFYNGSTLLFADAAAPYSYTWNNVAKGTYTITAVATDNEGATKTSTAITLIVKEPKKPYNTIAKDIPGSIEAEEYDFGGQGVSFNDLDTNNQGDATFRGDAVDLENTGDTSGIYDVGWIMNGEWLEYTVNVMETGTYSMYLRVAVDGDNRTLHVEMDGVDITGAINLPNTGGWQAWQTVTVNNLNLTAGEKQMRVVFTADYQNLNYLSFVLTDPVVTTVVNNSQKDNLQCYPNPFTDYTLAKVKGAFNYTVTDMMGRIVEQGTGTNEVKIGNALSTGMYILNIKSSAGVYKIKIHRY